MTSVLRTDVGASSCTPWHDRMWPSPEEWRSTRLPEKLIVALGDTTEYRIDLGACVLSSHTNPAICATERQTGRKVLLKLRLNAFEVTNGSVTVPSNGQFPELKGRAHGVFTRQWSGCGNETGCDVLAQRSVRPAAKALRSLRRVPFESAKTDRLRAAVGVGSLRDELFVHALLSPQVCGKGISNSITPLLDVLEFSKSSTPPALRKLALQKLAPGAAPLPTAAQYIYALVFPRYDRAPRKGTMPHSRARQAEMRALLTALARAARLRIINRDLRSGHVMFDPADHGSFRLTDWDNAIAADEAAGHDLDFPRDTASSCVIHQPAVPVHVWGEMLLSGEPTTIAPESLFAWLDGGRHGCRFSPALDIWHAGVRLAELLGCSKLLKPSELALSSSKSPWAPPAAAGRAHGRTSVVSTLATLFGTQKLYRVLDTYGWQLDRSCTRICHPWPGPLKFTDRAIRNCVDKCWQRASTDPRLVSRHANLPPMSLASWCNLPDSASPEMRAGVNLLAQMVSLDPAERITATAALQHDFITHNWTSVPGPSGRDAATQPPLQQRIAREECCGGSADTRPAESPHPKPDATCSWWCHAHSKTWTDKCTWAGCGGCGMCSPDTSQPLQQRLARQEANCGPGGLLHGIVCTLELQSSKSASRVRSLPQTTARTEDHPPHLESADGAVLPRVGYVLLASPFPRGIAGRGQGTVHEANVLQMHLRALAALRTTLIRKLLVMLPSRETGHGGFVDGYLNIEPETARLPFEATLVRLPNNTLGSYGMYFEAFRLSDARDAFEYLIFAEDDCM